MKYLNKITMAAMGLGGREAETIALDNNGKEVPALRVYGKVSSTTAKEGDLGPYIIFNGQFECQSLLTDEKARSDKLIVPALAETCFNEVYMKGLTQAQEESDGKMKPGQVVVTIGGDITIMENPSTKGGWKHKYGIAPLVEAVGEDDLTRLAATFPKPKMIKAPSAPSTGSGTTGTGKKK